jgi:nicotinamidase-related amidase
MNQENIVFSHKSNMSRPGYGTAVFDTTKANSPLSVPAANTAVLLMDYQNITVSFVGKEKKSTVQVAAEVRDWALGRNIPIYHCLVRTSGPNSAPPAQTKMSDRWPFFESAIRDNPTLAEECEETAPKDTEREKEFLRAPGQISVLYSEGLMEELKEKQIRSLIVAGLSTSGCVMSTVRGAADQGFVITVVEDACADPVSELHDLLMKHALASTAHIATLEEMKQGWKSVPT